MEKRAYLAAAIVQDLDLFILMVGKGLEEGIIIKSYETKSRRELIFYLYGEVSKVFDEFSKWK